MGDSLGEESGIEPRRDSCSFYVTGVPPVVFSKDPEASIRVSDASSLIYT